MSIPIRNIYYMLMYAVQDFPHLGDFDAEPIENAENLFAKLLSERVAVLLKHGLYREYINIRDERASLRGKADITASIKLKMQRKQRLVCEYDELSENNRFNQIIKTTLRCLFRHRNVQERYKKTLREEFTLFSGVDEVSPNAIHWSTLKYQRSNQSYRPILRMCYFVLEWLLPSDTLGKHHLPAFLESEGMARLYESFLREFYRFHYAGELSADAAHVPWALGEGENDGYLPAMKTDIMLTARGGGKTLIIDAKYYAKTMQTGQYGKKTFHSHNMYQIFTYVANRKATTQRECAGMLLYAKTDEAVIPNSTYTICGSTISVKTLDLNTDFSEIYAQLTGIARGYFDIAPTVELSF